jgi:hypothetical protein
MTQPTNDLIAHLKGAFAAELECPPRMTLRSGDSVDSFGVEQPHHVALDVVTDRYLSRYAWGMAHLDAASWRHYLPAFAAFALRNPQSNELIVTAFIQSLRPPDRDPPRLESLNATQQSVMKDVLEVLAYSPESIWQAEACQALEEWWIDGALYRPSKL